MKKNKDHKKQNNIAWQLISANKKERLSLFREIPENRQGFVLLDLPKKIQREIMKKLQDRELIELVDYLDPNKATDLLQEIEKRKRERVLKKLRDEIKKKVEFLLKFHPKTAAGLMSLDYLEVGKDINFGQLSEFVQDYEKKTGKFPAILVVEDGFLVGEVPGSLLALHSKNEKIEKAIKRAPTVRYDQQESEVIEIFKKHPHNKIVVLDSDESILGVIYSDDLLKIIERKSADILRGFAGVSEEEDILDSALLKVKHRYKWLIINLGTAFLAAGVVSFFQETISAFVLLAVYMPIVAGMGGNAGTQTLAVVVRGLALKEIQPKTAKRVILNEITAGAVNGIINGLLVAGVAVLWNKNPLLGLIIGMAMVINLIVAGFFGTIIPLAMKRLGKDPASSATVFITTTTDVFGFFVFLGLAQLLL